MGQTANDQGERVLTPKGRATRDRIVAAAASLMFERGVSQTTIEDVQELAGVGASQMYHYFADRQALIRAVITHQAQDVLAKQQPLLGALDSVEAMRAWRDLFVSFEQQLACKGGCPMGSLAGELAEISDDYRTDLARGFSEWQTAIGDGIRAMHSRGVLPPDVDPDQLALALLGGLEGGLLLTQLQRNTAPLEAALDTMIAYVECLTHSTRTRPATRRRGPRERASDR